MAVRAREDGEPFPSGTLPDLSFHFAQIQLAERWNLEYLLNLAMNCTTNLEVSTLTETKIPELLIRPESDQNLRISQNEPNLTEKRGEMSETPQQKV